MKKITFLLLILLCLSIAVYAEVFYSVVAVTPLKKGNSSFISIITKTPDLKICKKITNGMCEEYKKLGWRVLISENQQESKVDAWTVKNVYGNVMNNLPTATNPYLSFKRLDGLESRFLTDNFEYYTAKDYLLKVKKQLSASGVDSRIVEPEYIPKNKK